MAVICHSKRLSHLKGCESYVEKKIETMFSESYSSITFYSLSHFGRMLVIHYHL